MRRLISPTGFALVACCFLLPFVAVSCGREPTRVTASYTGVRLLIGGRPQVTVSDQLRSDFRHDTGSGDLPMDKLRAPAPALKPQPLAIAAFALTLLGAAGAALPRARRRAVAGAGAAGLAGLFLVGAQLRVRNTLFTEVKALLTQQLGAPVMDGGVVVQTRLGFWLAISLLVALAAGGAAQLVRETRDRPAPAAAPGPARAAPELDGGAVPEAPAAD